jgi:FMN phosphatase YigB (HAD superfamily)
MRLCVVSNVDGDLFEAARRTLGVKLDEVVTAEDVRSYKPAPAHFREALRRLGLPAERVVHVAQSLFHDVEPATRLGLQTVWVDRRGGRPGGATKTPAAAVAPTLRVKSLTELADAVDAGAEA